MRQYTVRFVRENIEISVQKGTTLLRAEMDAGLRPDAPCGGRGTCGKCRVRVNGKPVLACQTIISSDLTVETAAGEQTEILTSGTLSRRCPDGTDRYALAYDVGTTTVVCYLLDGRTGETLAKRGMLNPQIGFGADVISRIQLVTETGTTELRDAIRASMTELARQTAAEAGIRPEEITAVSAVGNTAMHHLMLGIDPKPLTTPPYMPNVAHALELPADDILPTAKGSVLRVLPNIAGFVGADTVGCLVSTRFDENRELTLLIDIGTNGEMVLGDRERRLACSTAAGPAFEGAKIRCGMRGAAGAIDHVWIENGEVRWHVIGEGTAIGLCGSGLLDLVAALLDLGVIRENGRMVGTKEYRLGDTGVILTQKDVREVQLAKAAIRAGIDLMAGRLGFRTEQICRVLLAGAFGNYLNPASACRIGMIPPCLRDRITGIGNAAGEGAAQCALSREAFDYSKRLAADTEFLELASLPQFQNAYIGRLDFPEKTE